MQTTPAQTTSLFGSVPGGGMTAGSSFLTAGNLGGPLFGTPAAAPAAQPGATAASLFPQTTPAQPMFGPSTPATTATQSQFGMTPTTTATQSQFGSPAVFGSPAPAAGGAPSVFGAAPTGSLFGGVAAGTQAQGFATVTPAAQQQQQQQPSIFGTAPQQGLFGGAAAAQPSILTSDLGGSLFAPRA